MSFVIYALLALVIVSLGVLALAIDLTNSATDLHDVFDEDEEVQVGDE